MEVSSPKYKKDRNLSPYDIPSRSNKLGFKSPTKKSARRRTDPSTPESEVKIRNMLSKSTASSRCLVRISKLSPVKMIKRNPIALYALLDISEENIGNELVEIFAGIPESLRLTIYCILSELDKTEDSTLLFRGSGTRIRLISAMFRHIGKAFQKDLISEILGLISEEASYEIDPLKIEPNEDINENITNLKKLTIDVLSSIQNSLEKLPKIMLIILELLYNETKKKFEDHGTSTVTGLFILRFLMPALALPESIGITPPPNCKSVTMEVSKILQFMYNQAEVKDQRLLPLNDFIVLHKDAPVVLTLRILQIAENIQGSGKVLKHVSVNKDTKKQAHEKITNAFFANPKALEDKLLEFLSGRHEINIEMIFEATRKEHVIMSKEFLFDRRYWLEHLCTWSIGQFDTIEYHPSEKFFLFLENRFSKEPSKSFKEYAMCEILVEHKDLGQSECVRIERNLFHHMTLCRLVNRVSSKFGFEVDAINLFYLNGTELKEFTNENWKDFESSVVVRKKDNTKWGSFRIIMADAKPKIPKKRSQGKSTKKRDNSPVAVSANEKNNSIISEGKTI